MISYHYNLWISKIKILLWDSVINIQTIDFILIFIIFLIIFALNKYFLVKNLKEYLQATNISIIAKYF
jgi:hypothetical protein